LKILDKLQYAALVPFQNLFLKWLVMCHVMSRTALGGFLFRDVKKEEFVWVLQRFSRVYFTEVLGFAVMGNILYMMV
jgi:hypothetical protein